MDKVEKKQSVMKSAAAMSMGTLSSRILGMVRDLLIASAFSRTVTDTFVVAFRLPNMFRRLLGEGSLSVSFIPVFVDHLHGEKKDLTVAKRLSNSLFTLLALTTSLICVFAILFMPALMDLLVSGKGFQTVPGKLERTILMARIMFSYLFLVTTYAYFMAIAQALKHFFIPAVAPALFNAAVIGFTLMNGEWFGFPGQRLALGVIAGGVIQVGLTAHLLWRLGYLPKFSWDFQIPGLKLVLRNMVPGIMGLGILQIMGLVNINFASRLKEGAHSYIYWADRILELPQSLIAISIGAALLPTLSQLRSEGKADEALREAAKHMRLLLFLSIPSAVGLFVLSLPIVQVIFQRGQFVQQDSLMTAGVVVIYSILLLSSSMTKVLVPGFYAIKNTWLPAVTSFVALVVHILLANVWTNLYGLQGLALSMTVSSWINMTLLILFYRKMVGRLHLKQTIISVIKFSISAALMGGLAYLIYFKGAGSLKWTDHSYLRVVSLAVTIGLCVPFYFIVTYIVKCEESQWVASRLKKKFLKT